MLGIVLWLGIISVSAWLLLRKRSIGFFYAGTRYKLTRAIGDIYFLTGRPDEAVRYFAWSLDNANDSVQDAEVHFSPVMIMSIQSQVSQADHHFTCAIEEANALLGLHDTYAVHLRRTGREAAAPDEETIAQQQIRAMRANAFGRR